MNRLPQIDKIVAGNMKVSHLGTTKSEKPAHQASSAFSLKSIRKSEIAKGRSRAKTALRRLLVYLFPNLLIHLFPYTQGKSGEQVRHPGPPDQPKHHGAINERPA
jgi:hypothetical protein